MGAQPWPSTIGLIGTQTSYQLRSFTRSKVAMFFTIVFPTIMLLLFGTLFGSGSISVPGEWSVQQFYVGGLAAFTAASATYTNLVNVIPIRRDEGVLKRWRSTPLPPSILLTGWLLSAVIIALMGALLQIVIGVLYGVEIEPAKLPAMLLTFVVGVAALAMLGLAVAGVVPTAEAAPAVANITILPLAFISNIFIPLEDPPRWVELVGGFFPLRPFAEALQDTINPFVDAPGFNWSALAVVAAWGVAGAVLARFTFKWQPSPKGSGGRRSRRRTHDADAVPSA